MNTIAILNILALADVQSSSVTKLILFLISLFFLIGFVSLIHSTFTIKKEQEALKWVEENTAGVTLNMSTLQQIILQREDTSEQPYLENSLVYSRLSEIARVLRREKPATPNDTTAEDKQVTPPQLQDLHRMTLQEIQSRKAPTWLRICASVLLIIGILGTLAGVHSCIGDQSGATSQLSALGSALKPSMFAVLGTIILYTLQSLYLMHLERFICYLDRLTMTKFLPDLQPASSFTQTMTKVAEQVDQFGKLIGGFDSIEKTAKEMQSTTAKFTEIAKGYEERSTLIKSNLDLIATTGKSITEAYNKLNTELDQTSENINKLAIQLGTAITREKETEEAAKEFAEMLNLLQSHITTVESTAQQVVTTQKQLQSLTEGAITLVPMQQSLDTLAENCQQLQSQIEQTRTDTQRVGTELSAGVSRLQGAFQNLENEIHKNTDDVQAMAANATEFKQYAEDMKKRMHNTLENGKNAIADMETQQAEVKDSLRNQKFRVEQLESSVRG